MNNRKIEQKVSVPVLTHLRVMPTSLKLYVFFVSNKKAKQLSQHTPGNDYIY